MKQFQASAPGKIILFGEHAVVYQRPAIAIPIHQVQATVIIQERLNDGQPGILLDAPQIKLQSMADTLPSDHPITILLRLIASALQVDTYPDVTLRINSSIPLASGMGSGAAISIAIIRALLGYLEKTLPLEQINSLAYQIEKKYHGTPSGIDNTVITYEQPIFFIRGTPFQRLKSSQEFSMVIADSGIPSTTLEVVADVRRGWQEETQAFEALFDQIGSIATEARQVIENGPVSSLGPLMNANQVALRKLGVSSPKLDYLIDAALFAGALGAKLSGGGRGGNIIALVDKNMANDVALALQSAGARSTIITTEFPDKSII
jgi:mevalonate kinase